MYITSHAQLRTCILTICLSWNVDQLCMRRMVNFLPQEGHCCGSWMLPRSFSTSHSFRHGSHWKVAHLLAMALELPQKCWPVVLDIVHALPYKTM